MIVVRSAGSGILGPIGSIAGAAELRGVSFKYPGITKIIFWSVEFRSW